MTLPDAPSPPARADVDTIDVGSLTAWRVWHPSTHTHAGSDLRWYGPLLRFDPHPPPLGVHDDIGIWYGAHQFPVALMEVYGRDRSVASVDVCGRSARASLVTIRARTRVVDLDADQPPAGLPTAIPDLGFQLLDSYDTTQAWGRALHRVRGVHGVLYRAARTQHLPAPHSAMALWQATRIGASRRDLLLSDPVLKPRVEQAFDAVGIGINWTCSRC